MHDGSVKPFPDEFWNRWDLKPETADKQFVCVQSVVADDVDALSVVDAAAPLLASVVPGGAKLVKIDLKTNQVSRVFPFGPDIAKANSYMNDVRVDNKTNTAYLTDSGAGGIVVLDLNSGSLKTDLRNAGAEWVDSQVIVDGNLVLLCYKLYTCN